MKRLFLAAGTVYSISFTAATADIDNYDDCLNLVTEDAALAEVQALSWYDRTGDPGALHCEALALAERGAHGPSAQRLASLAASETMERETRAALLRQAAVQWKAAGDLSRAREALNQGLKIHESADLFSERALIQIAEGQAPAARYDIDRALSLKPRDPELLTLRAAVKRRLGDAPGARKDAADAVIADPENPETWLELGHAEWALGQNGKAREAWLSAIATDPDSAAAQLARQSLQDMDFD